MVTSPTRENNILDLIFTSHPSFTPRCKTLPSISAKSDHDVVFLTLPCNLFVPDHIGAPFTFGTKPTQKGLKVHSLHLETSSCQRTSTKSRICGNPSTAPSTLSRTNSSLPAVQHLGSPTHGLIPSCVVFQNARYVNTRRQNVPVVLQTGPGMPN
ncbi:hypothetical protein DPMN_022727 [Dreissena polymorpha]|uniref:Uncharacterized protein n=1 Tax=Dreissena polymorpha TaxID=45954 RepID=A0A9D4NQQ2_DREPO|nr:hypothetical protein DPMN_022727 [Dreissena polymorpha]